MRILHYMPVWLPQTQTWLYTQLKYLPHDITNFVVCHSTDNLEQFPISSLVSLNQQTRIVKLRNAYEQFTFGLGFRRDNSFLEKMIRLYQPDLLHSHFGHTAWYASLVAERLKLKHVVTFYGHDVTRLPTVLPRFKKHYRQLFAKIDRVLCEGPHMLQELINLGCPLEKGIVHRLGVKIDNIKYRVRNWDGKRPLNVLLAASFREKKGLPYALEALGRFRHKVPLSVTIIGDSDGSLSSNAEKKKIMQVIKQHDLGQSVQLLGFRSHETLLAEADKNDIFITPSIVAKDGDTEGGAPIALVEMSATGMMVISTFHCDIPQVVKNGATGWLVNERDSNGLLEALMDVVVKADRWEEYAKAAREHIEVNFNAKTQGLKLAQLYTGIK